ncbi:MAG: ABC transporter ATP-binding protein [Lachnospiraceae bacterium]|jgi:ABC-2 type transport system ATP-binding protein|nr:ABC transporter ATP-binding protein [Lachnospiraceae bacterium]
MTNILEINNLQKSFGEVKVLEGLSFTVPADSIFGFVGVNGAGKTTTMRMVLGLLERDGGEITLGGEPVSYGKTVAHVGYLPDIPEFYPYMKPMEYLTLCGEIAGMPRERIGERGRELLELVGLKAKRKIGGFSRGMKQRLGIAQALLNEPKLLICDEPTSALDPMGRKEILDILLAVKGQTTVIFSTHILSDVERICDRVVFLHEGKAVLEGTLAQMKQRRADSYALEFADPGSAAKLAAGFANAVAESGNTVTVKNTDGAKIIKTLAEKKLTPIKFELLEPTLEDLFLEVVK